MKRIVSVLVAVLLLSSCFLSLPVLADGTGTSGEPVEVANIDFAKKYQDLNLTQPTDALEHPWRRKPITRWKQP